MSARNGRTSCLLWLGVVAAALFLSAVQAVSADNTLFQRQAMANAMLNMMEAMGFTGNASGGAGVRDRGGWGSPTNLSPFGSWPSAPSIPFGGWPSSPSMPGGGWPPQFPFPGGNTLKPSQTPGDSQGASNRTPYGTPAASDSLDGAWLSNTDEWLLIRGDQFRISAGDQRQLAGLVRSYNDRLFFFLPDSKRILEYEYAQHQGRLALRDADGNLFLYRRVENPR